MDLEEYLPKSETTVAIYDQWDKKMKTRTVIGRSESRVFLFEDGKRDVRFTEATHFKSLKFVKEKTGFPKKAIVGMILVTIGLIFLITPGLGYYYSYYGGGYYPGPGTFIGPLLFFIGGILILVGFLRKGGALLVATSAGFSVTLFTKNPLQMDKMKQFVQKGLPTIF